MPAPPPPGAPGGPIHPPGGYPGGPAPAKKGGGAIIAVVAVGVVLLLVGVGVLALVLTGDDDDDPGRTSGTATTAGGSGPTDDPATTGGRATELPPTSDDAPGTTADTGTTASTPDVPSAGDIVPPDSIPRPPGATEGLVGLTVEGQTPEQVRDFYVDALPGAGFTVGEVQGIAGSVVIPLTGNGLDGQLVVTDTGILGTSILWTAL